MTITYSDPSDNQYPKMWVTMAGRCVAFACKPIMQPNCYWDPNPRICFNANLTIPETLEIIEAAKKLKCSWGTTKEI